MSEDTLVPGRACGSCTMCCKVFRIPELDKAAGDWCRHVAQGRGCGIHPTRPETCRAFFCHWLRNGALGEEWKPDRARFVIYVEAGGRRLVVATDRAKPRAWTAMPYYAQFKRWATLGVARDHQVVVFMGERATIILPDRDVDLGPVAVGDEIVVRPGPSRYEVEHRRAS